MNKIASAFIVGLDVVLMVMFWIGLRSALLPDEGGSRTPTYLLLGITLGMITAWALLTKQETGPTNKALDE